MAMSPRERRLRFGPMPLAWRRDARPTKGPIRIHSFEPGDLLRLDPLDPRMAAQGAAAWLTRGEELRERGLAWTVTTEAGRVIACAGFLMPWEGRACAWCFLADGIPKGAWVALHRATLLRIAQLTACGVWRVECEVAVSYAAGIRWAQMIGFECEGIARRYAPTGEDHARFAFLLPPPEQLGVPTP